MQIVHQTHKTRVVRSNQKETIILPPTQKELIRQAGAAFNIIYGGEWKRKNHNYSA